MKLSRVRVQNYRSIVDSGEVDIERGVTVLIGKNEQGKSNFLKALASFNESLSYASSDLPNHLRPQLEAADPKGIPIVTLWFDLEPEDREEFRGLLDSDEKTVSIKATRYFGNNYSFWQVSSTGQEGPLPFGKPNIDSQVKEIRAVTGRLLTKLEAHAQRVGGEFANSKEKIQQIGDALVKIDFSDPVQIDNAIQTFGTSLKGLPGQDSAIQEDIATAIKESEAQRVAIQGAFETNREAKFRQLLPTFVLHITRTDYVPNEVSMADFVRDPDGTSRGMANVCRAANLSIAKIQELASTTDIGQREAYEDHHKSQISGGLNEFWTQEKYVVHFRIEGARLRVSISDNTYSPRIAPSDRSEGFQWYLSFYCSVLSDTRVKNKTVLLLDNPGLELHLDGQADIKRFLEQKISLDSQVIYVSHSPAMVDPYNLEQVRRVELSGNQEGTKVRPYVPLENQADLLEPVRSALGARIAHSLFFGDFNVLVEGAADKPILDAAFGLFPRADGRGVLVNGSISESSDFLPKFYRSSGLPFVVFLDADDTGRRVAQRLQAEGMGAEKVAVLDQLVAGRGHDFSLEDVVSGNLYHKAVEKEYPGYTVAQPDTTGRKRTRAYEEWFRDNLGIGFSKRRVGMRIKTLLEAGEGDEETLRNLKTVVDGIHAKLDAQG